MTTGPAQRDAAIQLRAFEQLAELVRRETGIALTAARKAQLLGKVQKRCEVLGCGDIRTYAKLLASSDGGRQELERLVSLATTNVTEFFRHPDQFRVFAKVVLPEVFVFRRQERLLRIWSAGCATGEEVYSIGMILLDRLTVSTGWDMKVLGTDLSREVLAIAERGVYPATALKNVPGRFVKRFFRTGTDGDTVRVSEDLQRITLFRRLNLVSESYPLRKDVDVIFFRNVAIYFEPDVRRTVLFRISEHLRPGGFLILGPAESLLDMRGNFEPIQANIFKKRGSQ